ncbi:MAG: ribonuclease M5 [Bacilli bacterium]|nr:ribonuclease M5 [Bacilli bacterium]
MKEKLDSILVVEGKSDVSYLSAYFDCEFVTTNGSDVPNETIEYLKEAQRNRKDIIVLTDPDSPGKRIRDILDENIPNLKHCFIEKKYAVKNNKVGVAECDIDEIKRSLKCYFVNKRSEKVSITMPELYQLGLCGDKNSKELREKVSKKLNLGYVNAKTLLKRLNSLEIDKEKLEGIINER